MRVWDYLGFSNDGEMALIKKIECIFVGLEIYWIYNNEVSFVWDLLNFLNLEDSVLSENQSLMPLSYDILKSKIIPPKTYLIGTSLGKVRVIIFIGIKFKCNEFNVLNQIE